MGRYNLSLLIFLLTAACAAPPPAHLSPFVVAIESAPTQLDPRLATDAYSERIGQLLFSRLIRINSFGEITPDLAKKWEIKRETTYIFHLKEGVSFHDGTPLTSEDVRYTYESILDTAWVSPHRKMYNVIDRIETPDAATVRFILKKPHAPFLYSLTRGIVPKHAASIPSFSIHPLGSGPFYFVQNDPDHAIALSAYSNYFGGAPRISRLLFRIIPEESVRLLELEKGNIDLIQNAFPPDAFPRLRRNRRFKMMHAPGTTYSYMGFNLRDPILKDIRVRRAIALAINREEIAKYIFKGLALPADGLLPPSHWAYSSKVATYSYNPEIAKRLLDEAGHRAHSGPRFTLTHKTSQNELARRVVEVLQQQLAEIGIKVDIRSHEWGTFYGDIKRGNFQMFTLSWVGVEDPDIYYNVFHSQSVPPDGSNRGHYQNAAIDQLVEKGRLTFDRNSRKMVYAKVQKILSEELPYVSLWHTENVAVMKKEVQGYTLYPDGDFYSLKDVYRDR